MRFSFIQDLHPSDLIIVHDKDVNINIQFKIDQVKVYFLQESSDLAVLAQIYGAGPVTGTEPQPAPDGLAHLTLITCVGNNVHSKFDHHTVVYVTSSKG